MKRTTDASRVNECANHPNVYPLVHGDIEGPMDLAPLVVNPQNVVLDFDGGVFLFVALDRVTFEVHTLFPAGAGAFVAAEESARYIFTTTDCETITTMVPATNVAARRLTEKMGFSFGRREGSWPTPNGLVPLDHYHLTLKRWVHTRIWQCQQQSLPQ